MIQMQSTLIENNSHQNYALHDFGNSLQDLLVCYWVYFPFKALLSVSISFLLPSIFASGDMSYVLNDYGVIIPLVLGGGLVIFGFPVLVKYFKYVYQMRNTSAQIDDVHFKKANWYEILRLGFMALLALIVLIFIILILQMGGSSSRSYNQFGYYERNSNIAQFIGLIIMGLLILLVFLITKVFSILSIIELNLWIKVQVYADSKNVDLIALESGLNLMKLGCIISFLSIPLGDALYNVGIARSAKGFRKMGYFYGIYPKSENLDREKTSKFMPPNKKMGTNSFKKSWDPEKCCQCCGSQRWDDKARFCSNCGEFFNLNHNLTKN